MSGITYVERPPLEDAVLNALFARAWPAHAPREFRSVLGSSLSYFGAFTDEQLVLHARLAAARNGSQWLHIDFEAALEPFYRRAGFLPTAAGLAKLREGDGLAPPSEELKPTRDVLDPQG